MVVREMKSSKKKKVVLLQICQYKSLKEPAEFDAVLKFLPTVF